MNCEEKKRFGFTLIELLIVVAIIAILAAIAVPNFIEAQVRAKVSRVKADQRSMVTALEAYMVDKNTYPPKQYADFVGGTFVDGASGQTALTTPVSYITSVPRDGFDLQKGGTFEYTSSSTKALPHSNGRGGPTNEWAPWPKDMFLLVSNGPDRQEDMTSQRFPNRYGVLGATDFTRVNAYDSSNGSVSAGDIYRWACPSRYNIIFDVGYDPKNGIDPTNGAYERWYSGG